MDVEKSSGSTKKPLRMLSLFDAVCIVVGTIIGAGIFQTAPDIATFSGSFRTLILLWIAGGALTIIGALCFAELTTRFKETIGGDYGYLKNAYGRPLAFLFAWSTFWIIRPGNIGAMAITFAGYFNQLLGITNEDGSGSWTLIVAIAAVLTLSAVNLIGLNQGRWTQNLLTVAKVLGILAIVAISFLFGSGEVAEQATDSGNPVSASPVSANWLLAIVFIMFSFGGWNDMSFIANEVKDPDRNLFRTLVFSAVVVTAIYLIINIAFVHTLGFAGTSGSKTVATDVIRTAIGEETQIGRQATRIIAGLICISCLGAINGIIITSPRIYYAAGRDYSALRFVGRWNEKRNQPWLATLLQAVVTILLFLLCFQYENPFNVILVASAPFFWAFLGLTGLALIVLRYKVKTSQEEDYFRVPFYPIFPIVLAIACFAMTGSAVQYLIAKAYWGAGGTILCILLVGVFLSLVLDPNGTPKIDQE